MDPGDSLTFAGLTITAVTTAIGNGVNIAGAIDQLSAGASSGAGKRYQPSDFRNAYGL